MKSITSITLALALVFSPAVFAAKGDGNSGQGVGNTGPGNQGNSKPAGNAGGNKPDAPKPPKPDAPKPDAPSTDAVDEAVRNSTSSVAPMVGVAFLLLAFMCERENNRDDKTDFVTALCTSGEMPDAFESYSN